MYQNHLESLWKQRLLSPIPRFLVLKVGGGVRKSASLTKFPDDMATTGLGTALWELLAWASHIVFTESNTCSASLLQWALRTVELQLHSWWPNAYKFHDWIFLFIPLMPRGLNEKQPNRAFPLGPGSSWRTLSSPRTGMAPLIPSPWCRQLHSADANKGVAPIFKMITSSLAMVRDSAY